MGDTEYDGTEGDTGYRYGWLEGWKAAQAAMVAALEAQAADLVYAERAAVEVAAATIAAMKPKIPD